MFYRLASLKNIIIFVYQAKPGKESSPTMLMTTSLSLVTISFLLQTTATILAFIKIRGSRFYITWIMASAVLSFMAIHRAMTLYDAFILPSWSMSLPHALVSLGISALALTGVIHLHPFIRDLEESKKRMDQFRLFFEKSPMGYQSLDYRGIILDINPVWLNIMGYSKQEVIGRYFGDFLTVKSHQDFASRFTEFKENRIIQNIRLELKRKDGAVIIGEFDGTISFDQLGNMLQSHCTFRDITRQVKAEEMLRKKQQQIRYNLSQQEFISELAIRFNTPHDFEESIDFALSRIGVQEQVDRVYAYIQPPDKEDTGIFQQWAAQGVGLADYQPGENTRGWYPDWSRWLKDNEIIRASQVTSLDQSLQEELVPRGIRSTLAVPLKIKERQMGFLVVEQLSRTRSWDDVEIYMLQTIAQIFSNAYERQKVEKALQDSRKRLMQLSHYQQKMIERDRRHFAHEIHDELGQYLTSIHMGLSWILKHLPADAVHLKSKTRELTSLTDTSLKQSKKLSAQYRPRIIDDMGLVAAIEWYVKEFEKKSHISCSLDLSDDPISENSEMSINLFRILQESLTNVYRHAQASHIEVKLNKTKNSLILHISDNGIGMKRKNRHKPYSYGITAMEERVRLIGAELKIETSENQGTQITVLMPLNQNLL